MQNGFGSIFKYENVPTFCFICGIMGHSEKFCSRLFEVSDGEINKPYGAWIRALLRHQTRLIGSKWQREGGEWISGTDGGSGRNSTEKQSDPKNQESYIDGENHGEKYQQKDRGRNQGNLNINDKIELADKIAMDNQGITIIEKKK